MWKRDENGDVVRKIRVLYNFFSIQSQLPNTLKRNFVPHIRTPADSSQSTTIDGCQTMVVLFNCVLTLTKTKSNKILQ